MVTVGTGGSGKLKVVVVPPSVVELVMGAVMRVAG
jgi:hypothetical protein